MSDVIGYARDPAKAGKVVAVTLTKARLNVRQIFALYGIDGGQVHAPEPSGASPRVEAVDLDVEQAEMWRTMLATQLRCLAHDAIDAAAVLGLLDAGELEMLADRLVQAIERRRGER